MITDLLSSHFNDIAILKKFKKINKYNEREYEDEKQISCRKLYKTVVIKNSNNEDIVSTITLYTLEKINDKDNIDNKDVLQISEYKSLYDNETIGYKVLLWVNIGHLKVLDN